MPFYGHAQVGVRSLHSHALMTRCFVEVAITHYARDCRPGQSAPHASYRCHAIEAGWGAFGRPRRASEFSRARPRYSSVVSSETAASRAKWARRR